MPIPSTMAMASTAIFSGWTVPNLPCSTPRRTASATSRRQAS